MRPTILTVILVVAIVGAVRGERRMVGGATELDERHPRRSELVHLAERHINLATNSLYTHKAFKINSITSQVVAGIKYVIDMDMKKTECTKNMNKQPALCGYQETEDVLKCKTSIWERPWLQDQSQRQIVDVQCH